MNDTLARWLFGYLDGFMSIMAGLTFVLFTTSAMANFAPGFADDPALTSPLARVLGQAFGHFALCIGLIELATMLRGSEDLKRMVVGVLLLGDLIHTATYLPFLWWYGFTWSGLVFGILYELLMISTRTWYVMSEHPGAPLLLEDRSLLDGRLS